MRILVDADACPVKDIIIKHAKQKGLEVIFYFDTAHIYDHDYVKTIIVPKGRDSVDMKLLNDTLKDDLCITNDYGLASLLITKTNKVISFNGLVYNEFNINKLLDQRYISSKLRKSKVKIKGPKKRTAQNDLSFDKTLTQILEGKNEVYSS